jgi:glutamate/tyrosine decarboxylase-like PLP-dependent enzyme
MYRNLREKMLQELEHKKIFKDAQKYVLEYTDKVRERNVFPSDKAINDLTVFAEPLPKESGDATKILSLLNHYGSPATVAQTGGRYFGFVDGGVIPVSLAARLLSDFWDQNTALYEMSPVASKLEEICEIWLRELLGLPDKVVAGFVTGSSLAIFCGIAAARYRVLKNNNWDINKKGFSGAPEIRVVAGEEAHGTVSKALALLGFGLDNVEWVETDAEGRIDASKIPELDENTILVLQAGNVCSGAFDPFEEICAKANDAKAWIHIDGAFGLWAAASDKLCYLTRGIEKANSFSLDGHKTLNTPYDNGIVLCNDQESLRQALHASGSYISNSANRDGMFYTPEMSRRARSIELWAALKYLGKAGVDELVLGLHHRALQFGDELKDAGFYILNDIVFNQVVVACDTDELTSRTMQNIQQSGECWVGGAIWAGKQVIRISVCSWVTSEIDIKRSVRAFIAARKKAVEE